MMPERDAANMDLYLVRHATSSRARLGVWGRLNDVPLEAGYQTQLTGAKTILGAVTPKVVFTSPQMRCLDTAQFVCPNDEPHIVPELRAYHSGLFETETEAWVAENHPHYRSLSFRDRFLAPLFDEESIATQAARVARGFQVILESLRVTPVVVAHYSTINIISHFCAQNWNLDVYADGVYDLEEGGVMRINFDPASVEAGLRLHFDGVN